MNDLNKQRSSRIKGPILSQKLGEDQKKNGHHNTNLILALLRLGGLAFPPGHAYDDDQPVLILRFLFVALVSLILLALIAS